MIDGHRVQAVGTKVRAPDGATVIDASGMVITPGLVAVGTRVGTLDIELEPSSVEATLPVASDPVRAALRTADTLQPARRSPCRSRARAGSRRRSSFPAADRSRARPRGSISPTKDWLRRGSAALRVAIDAPGGPPGPPPVGVRSAAFLRLREALTDARLYRANRGPFLSNKLRALSISAADLEVLDRALARELIVLVEVNRASDIRTVVEIANEYGLRVVIVGGAEAWQHAALLAREQIPVVLDPFDDLPAGFGALHSRGDAAAILQQAGVRVMLADLGSPHFAHRLRQAAGNAVAAGLPYDAAIASLTSVPAAVFGVADAGAIRAGRGREPGAVERRPARGHDLARAHVDPRTGGLAPDPTGPADGALQALAARASNGERGQAEGDQADGRRLGGRLEHDVVEHQDRSVPDACVAEEDRDPRGRPDPRRSRRPLRRASSGPGNRPRTPLRNRFRFRRPGRRGSRAPARTGRARTSSTGPRVGDVGNGRAVVRHRMREAARSMSSPSKTMSITSMPEMSS